MYSWSGSSSSSKKRGRPPNKRLLEAEATLIRRLREIYGITKDIKIELRRCDAEQINCTRSIDLPSSIVEVNGLIASPSGSLSSYTSSSHRHHINGIIRPKLKSKEVKNTRMAPGIEISSPRSTKRLQKDANPSSNGNSSHLSSDAQSSSSSQVSPRKLSRYPHRSTRSRSGSTDTGVLPVDEESTESLPIPKARRVKKKIIECELSSPAPSKSPPPPSEAEIPPPTKDPSRKKKRRLPVPLRSRSNSTNDLKIIEEDNEPLTSSPTTAVPNGLHIDPEMLGSDPPPSPPPARVAPKRKRGKELKSRAATPSVQDNTVVVEVPSTSLNTPLSSNENGNEVDLVDRLLASPSTSHETTPPVSPKRRRGRPPKSASSNSNDIVNTLKELSTSPAIPGPSTRERSSEANIPVQPEPESPPKTNSLGNPNLTELEISDKLVHTSVIVTVSSPSCSKSQSESLRNPNGTTATPPPAPSPPPVELEGRLPSQVIRIRTPSPSKESVLRRTDTVKPSNVLVNSPVSNGPVSPQLFEESGEWTDDDLGDFEEPIRFKMKPVKPNILSFQRTTKNSSCAHSPQPSTSRAASEKDISVNLTSPPTAVPRFQKKVISTPPRSSSATPQQNELNRRPQLSLPSSDDEVIDISTDDDDGSSDLEITEVKSLSESNFLHRRFPTPPARVAYYCCVMWDMKVLNELQCHEDSRHQLYVANSIGKLLSESLKSEGHTFPGVARMDWKKKFLLLDIITADFRKCGRLTSLRVQEKACIDTIKLPHHRPPKWELVIHPECLNIGEEMVRMHRSGVKTTVVIWGAHISAYPNRWNGNKGELFLKPAKTDREALSVIIFHHEILSHERFRLIQDAHQGSELWPSFQDPQLNHRLLTQADLVHMENPTHFTLHAEKLRNSDDLKATINNVNIVEMEDEDCEEVNEFPEVDFCDQEDFEDDDEFSLYPENPDVDDWDDLESASCMGVGSAGENLSSPDVQTSVSQDMAEIAARIFRRSESVPAVVTPPRDDVYKSPGRVERRSSSRENGEVAGGSGGRGDKGGAGVAEMESNQFRVVSDSQKKFLLTQELVASDDEGNGPHELEQTVLTCDEDFVTGDEGSLPSPVRKSPVGAGTKVKNGSNQTNLCNGYGPPKKKMNLSQNGKSTGKDVVKSVNGNGTDSPPPSNSEHSEYNFSALLQEF